MRKFQWSLGVGTEKQANAVRSDSRLMTNRRSTHLTFHLHLVKPKSWITGNPEVIWRSSRKVGWSQWVDATLSSDPHFIENKI